MEERTSISRRTSRIL